MPALLFFGALAREGSAQVSPPDYAAQKPYEAHVVAATGEVTRVRDQQPWAISRGDGVPVRQIISTGQDGYARLEVTGGSSFDLFADSRVVFRQNTASEGDLLDVVSGRVRVRLHPTLDQPLQRIFTPSAIVAATEPALISIAVDEDNTVRIDVMEGEVKIQHTLLPSTSPVVVRAVDAVLVKAGEPISYRVDRGSLYRYTVKPIIDLWTALTPSHNHDGTVTSKLLASNFQLPFL
jgi:hypothetical protein